MKDSVPNPFSNAKVGNHGGDQQQRANGLHPQGRKDNKAGQPHNAAHLRRGNGFLHHAALHQPYLPAGQKRQGNGSRHHTHAADLNERQDHSLTKGRPACSCILHDQSRNAYGGSSGKQAIQKPHASRFSAGVRQGKQQRANQDQRNEAKGNDLKCGHSILSKEPHAFTPFLI